MLATGSSASLSIGTWYDAKVVIDDSGGQRLRFWVDDDADGFDAGDLLLTDTAYIDANWTAGYVRILHVWGGGSAVRRPDNRV